MADDSLWLYDEISNPADLAPACKRCGKPGDCLMPLEVNHRQRKVTATYRCANRHEWKRVFRPGAKPVCAS